MSTWKKITNSEVVIDKIGNVALEKFLAGEIFLINLHDQQTQKELIDVVLYQNIQQSTTNTFDSKPQTDNIVTSLMNCLWEKIPKSNYLLLSTYSDGSRGIFYNNMPFSPIKLDEKKLSNCWEKRQGLSEAFCYDDNRELLVEFIRLLDQSVSLDEIMDEITHYFQLSAADLNPTAIRYKCG